MSEDVKQYIDGLQLDAIARWLCLIQGVDYIFDKLEQDNKQEDYIFRSKKSFNILQRSLIKYINQRFQAMKWDITSGCQSILKEENETSYF